MRTDDSIGYYVTFPYLSQVGTDTNWNIITAGTDFTLSIKTDGTLWAWGQNENGQLGLGNTTDRKYPTQVGTDTDWKIVVAGRGHTIALKTDGTLWAWGNNTPWSIRIG